ncbi:SDR family NAD(P)-dependent oxidoreductase [Candidatus Profftella armatura]|uniref:SDR family NAD(P)-dependent oxidoreductase n=1 Tax=Candidatus Profftella armatura TaxID=669502 RepID=UPI003D955FD6
MYKILENFFNKNENSLEKCFLEAAKNGLFIDHQPPKNLLDIKSIKNYILLNLKYKPYCIRPALLEDIPKLMKLEKSCWNKLLRTPEFIIKNRICNYPAGQLVLLMNNKISGVIYSQLIKSVKKLANYNITTIDTLHNINGSIAQLLAVNIFPNMQQQNLGDQLLEFTLIYYSLQIKINLVVAITLCKNFNKLDNLSLSEYIKKRNIYGMLIDPILYFHESHGAIIKKLIPNYRPLDYKNNGYGVLINYDIKNRKCIEINHKTKIKKNNKYNLEEISDYIKKIIYKCLSFEFKKFFSIDTPLMDMGLDSSDLLFLSKNLSSHYQLNIDSTFLFYNNTVNKIISYFYNKINNINIFEKNNKPYLLEKNFKNMEINNNSINNLNKDIAIIGLACYLPKGINTLSKFWKILKKGSSVIEELNESRWIWPLEIDIKNKHKGINFGAFLKDIECFDAPFFKISPIEAESMDPQQRILLELSWKTIEDAGYDSSKLSGSNTGVFIGASGSDYTRLLSDYIKIPVNAHHCIGNSMAVLANRISYFYNFTGPSLLIDTACSSSLVAVHEALQSIKNGESSQALVGGINLILHPSNTIAYYKAGMLSRDGICKTFDKNADGYVRGEGAVMLMLKPLSVALNDHDNIYAIIKGSAITHNGQSNGLTAPNPIQQSYLLQKAWNESNIDVRSLGYIECHGTGTKLGDPIEIQGLKNAFHSIITYKKNIKNFYEKCGLGSVKTNLGHLEAASGITGILKIILCLKNKKLPASLNFYNLNKNIKLDDSHLYIIDHLQDWVKPKYENKLRIAGVSSFGSGGTNAHVVLSEYNIEINNKIINNISINFENSTLPLIFVLSAKTKSQLLIYVKKYIEWLNNKESLNISLRDLTLQLQKGRQAMNCRLALVIFNRDDLLSQLNFFYEKKIIPMQDKLDSFNESKNKIDIATVINLAIKEKNFKKIAILWQSGININWSLIDKKNIRISLPTYPFSKYYYWLPKNNLIKKISNSDDTQISNSDDTQISNSDDTQISNSDDTQISNSDDTQISNSDDTQISNSDDTQISNSDDTQISNSDDTQISNSDDTQISNSDDTQISNSDDTQISNSDVMQLSLTWDPIIINYKNNSYLMNRKLLVIGANLKQKKIIQSINSSMHEFFININESVDIISYKLSKLISKGYKFDHIIWITPQISKIDLINYQDFGVLLLFKFIKALLSQKIYSSQKLIWTIITYATQEVFDTDLVSPGYASIHGLSGVLAKEYPFWVINLLDLEFNTNLENILVNIPKNITSGETIAYRNGQWFKGYLCSIVNSNLSSKLIYKQKGIYIVIGGSGGIGKAWTNYVIKKYSAQVIWICKSKLDDNIQKKLDKFKKNNSSILYISADACDLTSLKKSLTIIKKTYPVINGIIHSAVSSEFDKSIEKMSIKRFQSILSIKIDASINIAKVFSTEVSDFIFYFSSIVAIEKNGGMSGYSAGGTFEDAYAICLSKKLQCFVRVINWGHWEIGTGKKISNFAKIRLKQSGRLPLKVSQAMTFLENISNIPLRQIIVMRVSCYKSLFLFNPMKSLVIYPDNLDIIKSFSSNFILTESNKKIQLLKNLSIFNNKIMEIKLLPLFAGILFSTGFLGKNKNNHWKILKNISNNTPKFYEKWLKSSIKFLEKYDKKNISIELENLNNLEKLWESWNISKQKYFNNSNLKSAIILVETCLKSLPLILSGKIRSTDIIFPNASMKMVNGIYCNNLVSDYFNEILAKTIVSFIKLRLQKEPLARIRIIEIGAGTGGTTSIILPHLHHFYKNISEYAYTDISKAFLFHAEKKFSSNYSYIIPKIFNIEKHFSDQMIEPGSYDIAIATNVLHATRNICFTLSNVKAVLRKNGLLLLNEISKKSFFAHLTFGLLEGWWLSEDQKIRIPDSPILCSKNWYKILSQEGFNTILFPAENTHNLGQQIIIAKSNGIIKQKISMEKKIKNNQVKSMYKNKNLSLKSITLYLKKIIAKVLHMDISKIDAQELLGNYGIDSILIIQITNKLRKDFSNISSTLLFEYKNISELANYLIDNYKKESQKLTKIKIDNEKNETKEIKISSNILYKNKIDICDNNDIAIIGMSCRFPKANNLKEYWELLINGKNCITEIPSSRWEIDKFYNSDVEEAIKEGKTYCKWGGFLNGFDNFDPLFFNISPKEANIIDPQERLFLQTAWETLEDAGYTRERLAKDFNHKVSVFVGVTRTGFDLFGPELWKHGSTLYPHTSFSSFANRVSYFLNIHGPSMPIDTMCSSSLTAIHQACQSLLSGESKLAIAGGVNLYLHPSSYILLSSLRMLSKDGICRSFGENANGFVPGEGVGAILLKPISKAIEDNDRIQAIIKATNINHGGKTNGYTVPNPNAQFELIKNTLKKANINARNISYIEAHGTGTELGDPIEISSLVKAFRNDTEDNNFCAIGSVKSNIGHLESASGIAGFIKVILQMKNKRLVPTLHAKIANPNINFSKTPFFLQQTLVNWVREKNIPRIAGISSFGAGGSNAHIIIEEFKKIKKSFNFLCEKTYIIILSARNEESLKNYIKRLYEFTLQISHEKLSNLSYTLQIGREAMDIRIAFIVCSLSELQKKLKKCLSIQDNNYSSLEEEENIFYGKIKNYKDIISIFYNDVTIQDTLKIWFQKKKYERLLKFWSKGMNIDWTKLYSEKNMYHCIALPTYPFLETPYSLPLFNTTSNFLISNSNKVIDINFNKFKYINFKDHGKGIFSIKFNDICNINDKNINEKIRHSCYELISCIKSLSNLNKVKVLMLNNLDKLFSDTINFNKIIQKEIFNITQSLMKFLFPIIIILTGKNLNYVMKISMACDLIICSKQGYYTDLSSNIIFDSKSLRKFKLLYPIVDKSIIQNYAFEKANQIIQSSSISLKILKKHLNKNIDNIITNLRNFSQYPNFLLKLSYNKDKISLIPFASHVIKLEKYYNDILILTICDRENKNMFSSSVVKGITDAFSYINSSVQYKVIIITGYENYFACGGTKEGLLKIQKGISRFTDEKSYCMPLYCKIPVIAAMQGHAIGAGWAMGLFCDYTIFSEESVYQSPYMRYGFTPGAGSTLIFPQRFGKILSREILFTASEFKGKELKERGISMPVLPRKQVLFYSLKLAKKLSLLSKKELELQKKYYSHSLQKKLSTIFLHELTMHDYTFVNNPSVITNIERYFDKSIKKNNSKIINDTISYDNSKKLNSRVFSILKNSLIEELQIKSEQFDDDAIFIDMGLDSIIAVTWIRKINSQLDLSINSTKIYDYPTLNKFFKFIMSQISKKLKSKNLSINNDDFDKSINNDDIDKSINNDDIDKSIKKNNSKIINDTISYDNSKKLKSKNLSINNDDFDKSINNDDIDKSIKKNNSKIINDTISYDNSKKLKSKNLSINNDDIAIIGISGQFPKANNVKKFWNNLLIGRNCVSKIPSTRWIIDDFYDSDKNAIGKTICKKMGSLEDIEIFDPLFFNISPSEAEYMDPQQRLFLQNCWTCIEDAGYNPFSLSGSLCGVFVGCAVSDYNKLITDPKMYNAYALMGESVSILPARVSYFLNLQGPCLAIDTACSSSLVAIAHACDSLILGNSKIALAGGVYIINTPDIHIKMSKSGMLSPDGHCYSFDQRANGFVPGEGVGVLMLKKLKDAKKDGDDIYCIIKGWGVNQDGKTNGITAPNTKSQIRLQTKIYKKFNINPNDIQLLEAHGTGTKLGDPIEFEALCESFNKFSYHKNFCALGSVKSNIGHSATAAGVIGMIKIILSLKHKVLPPTINYNILNEHIKLENSPFFINTKCKSWDIKNKKKRMAAINSFGFSGTNAHIVLMEKIKNNENIDKFINNLPIFMVFPLSAKNLSQLLIYAKLICNYISKDLKNDNTNIFDFIYTFQFGRAVMSHRLAIVISSFEELYKKLLNFIKNYKNKDNYINNNFFYGKIKSKKNNKILKNFENINKITDKNSLEISIILANKWVNGEYVDWKYLQLFHKGHRKHGLPTYPFSREYYWISKEKNKYIKNNLKSSDVNCKNNIYHELLDSIDLQDRLHFYKNKKIIFIHTEKNQFNIFKKLLLNLKKVSNTEDKKINNFIIPIYYNFHSSIFTKELFFEEKYEIILIFNISKVNNDITLLLEKFFEKFLNGYFGYPIEIIFFIQLKINNKDYIMKLINDKINLSTNNLSLIRKKIIFCDDYNEFNQLLFMQRLCIEWLIPEKNNKLIDINYIYYLNNERFIKKNIKNKNLEENNIYLINKDWIVKEPYFLKNNIERKILLVLVNEDSIQLVEKIFNLNDFQKIILISINKIDYVSNYDLVNLNDINLARINTQLLVNKYDNNITHIIDLSDIYNAAHDYDNDQFEKIVFYQIIINTINEISILYFTKELQNFKFKKMTLSGSKFSGIIKMISSDYQHIDSRCIDVDDSIYNEPMKLRNIIFKEFNVKLQETEICYRNNKRYVPILLEKKLEIKNYIPFLISYEGVYVITGGTNGVGLEIAKYFIKKGCKNIVLMGITNLPPKKDWEKIISNNDSSFYLINKLKELTYLKRKIKNLKIYIGSLSDLNLLKKYFTKIRNNYGPIKGVIHCAGTYSNIKKPGFSNKNIEDIKKVWEPKIKGIENLHEVFKSDPLDFFISFSSMAGLIPHLARGSSDYASANTYMSFFSIYQQFLYKNIFYKNIIISDWNQTGALTRVSNEKFIIIEKIFNKLGMRTFNNKEGKILFEKIMNLNNETSIKENNNSIIINYLNLSIFHNIKERLLYARPFKFKSKLMKKNIENYIKYWEEKQQNGIKVSIQEIIKIIDMNEIKKLNSNFIDRIHKLITLNKKQKLEEVKDNKNSNQKYFEKIISKTMIKVLKLKEIDFTETFQNYGLDSISAMVLSTKLEKKLKYTIKPQWLIDFNSVKKLSVYLSNLINNK